MKMTIELDGITAGTLEVARVARAISRTKARLKAHFQRLPKAKNKCKNRPISLASLTITAYGSRMTEIKVEITRTTKPYVGLITGEDAQYGFALEFLPLARKSSSYHTAVITAPGQYKLVPGAVVGVRRIDTGYIRVNDAGEVTEIQKGEVVL